MGMLFFCQKSEEFQKNYIKKLSERLARDGHSREVIEEVIENIKEEKLNNIPTLESIENDWPID